MQHIVEQPSQYYCFLVPLSSGSFDAEMVDLTKQVDQPFGNSILYSVFDIGWKDIVFLDKTWSREGTGVLRAVAAGFPHVDIAAVTRAAIEVFSPYTT